MLNSAAGGGVMAEAAIGFAAVAAANVTARRLFQGCRGARERDLTNLFDEMAAHINRRND